MRERGIDKVGEWMADWLEHLQYKSEVKMPDEDKTHRFYKVIYCRQNQQNISLLVCMPLCTYTFVREESLMSKK